MKTCPNCGHALTHFVGAPHDWAPWQCSGCSRGWWAVETTAKARALWRGETGWDESKRADMAKLRKDVDDEHRAAVAVRLLANQGRGV